MQYEEIQFTSTSQDAISYLWDFGGGLTSTEANPRVQFLTTGDVVVKLTAINDKGEHAVNQTITVEAPDNYVKILGNISYIDGTGEHLDALAYDGSKMVVDSALWKSATEIRLFATDAKFTKPLLIKFKPNVGLTSLNQEYTYSSTSTANTW